MQKIKQQLKYWAFSIFILMAVVSAGKAFADCPQFYPNGQTIQPFGATELCNSFFVTQYDDGNKRALFSSEILVPNGHDLPRKNSFHADKRSLNAVKPPEYSGTKKDKGHLVPCDDATSDEQMFETFLMTNMTPQDPKLNRGPWKGLESHVRKEVQASGAPAIVVTGALYESQEMMGRVPVPTGYFKIVYLHDQKPVAYYVDNNDVSKPHEVQMDWIITKTNMKFPK